MNKSSSEFSPPNTSMVDVVLNNIDEDLKARFPDKDAGSLMEDLGKDLMQINTLFNVLADEYEVDKKGAIKKWQKSESIPEPMCNALNDLNKIAWDITLVNTRYILGRIKKLDVIGWKHMDSQQRSDMLSIGLKAAHRVVLNHNPSTGVTQGKIFQALAPILKRFYFSMSEKVSGGQDWFEINKEVENRYESDDDPEKAVDDIFLSEILDELIINNSAGLTSGQQQAIKLLYLYAPNNKPTLEEVARKVGVTIERVRQIEGDALAKLRYPVTSKKLRDFFDN